MFVGQSAAVQEAVMMFVVHVIGTERRGGLLRVVLVTVTVRVHIVVGGETEVFHEAGASGAAGATYVVVLRARTGGDDEGLSV